MPNDFNIPMSDAQITEALQLMVERVSEGWAQETYDGSPVGSGSPYYHKSSKYWATRSEDAAARAEAAVPAGTAGAVFFDRTQTLTDAQKAQARQNIQAGGSNRNLLMNGWFTVNQRGVTTLTANGYIADRWVASSVPTGANVVNNGDGTITINLPSGSGYIDIIQKFETDFKTAMVGKEVTISAVVNGEIKSVKNNFGSFAAMSLGGVLVYNSSGVANNLYLRVFQGTAAKTVIIGTPKLELGSVSTLPNDAPPCYAEELAKCQYYFERINAISNMELGVGIGTSSILYLNYNAKPKRAYPTLTLTGTVKTARSAVENTATSIAQQWFDVNTGLMHLGVNVTATAATPYRVILMADSHIDLSADL